MIKKFINDNEEILEELIEGLVKANDTIEKLSGKHVILNKTRRKDKVNVIIGNGSGHEPACIGFVGNNMLSANAYGEIFTAPTAMVLLDAIEECSNEMGVCVLISNHAGDVLNSKMAIDMADDDGYKCKSVILYDDIASAKKDEIQERRGTIGTMFNYKITSTYANKGYSLDEVCKMAEKVRDNTRSLTVATITGTSPITGLNMFELADDEIEIGMGVHGESAAHNMKMDTSYNIADVMVNMLVDDKPYNAGDELAVVVNGCGQTTLMELFIFFNDVEKLLANKGIKCYKPAIGNFITTQEMGGIALSFCKVDKEMKECWAEETNVPYFPW